MQREQFENVLRTIDKCSVFCSVWKGGATLAAMRSLDRLLAANEKLLKILIFSKTVQNTSKSFQTADFFTNVTMNLYTNENMVR